METSTQNLRASIILWEKLRIAYNAILFAVGVPIALSMYHMVESAPASKLPWAKSSFDSSRFIEMTVVFGLAANLCYCLGPFIDVYYQLLFRRSLSKAVRYTAFLIGLFLSIALVIAIWLGLGFALK